MFDIDFIKDITQKAASELMAGQVVAFPTETVYGLGADIRCEHAISQVYKLKGRPTNHPLIVHVHQAFDFERYGKITPTAKALIDAFWPGPLTLILDKTKYVPESVTANQQTVGLRSPNHLMAQAILKAVSAGVAAPSANKFGYISPTRMQHVLDEYPENNFLIVPDNALYISQAVGIESTIIDARGEQPILLRRGMLDGQMILEKTGLILQEPDTNFNKTKPTVSGSLLSHYAPHHPLKLLTHKEFLNFQPEKAVACLLFQPKDLNSQPILISNAAHHVDNDNDDGQNVLSKLQALNSHVWYMPNSPDMYAKVLYNALREADKACSAYQLKDIVLVAPPQEHAWLAIIDRLQRASYN